MSSREQIEQILERHSTRERAKFTRRYTGLPGLEVRYREVEPTRSVIADDHIIRAVETPVGVVKQRMTLLVPPELLTPRPYFTDSGDTKNAGQLQKAMDTGLGGIANRLKEGMPGQYKPNQQMVRDFADTKFALRETLHDASLDVLDSGKIVVPDKAYRLAESLLYTTPGRIRLSDEQMAYLLEQTINAGYLNIQEALEDIESTK